MKKQAIGISLNGRELRIAHLTADKRRFYALSLETILLPAVESPDDKVANKHAGEADGLNLPQQPEMDDVSNEDIAAQLVHSLLLKYANKNIRVGLNIPTTEISYLEGDDDDVEYPKKTWFSRMLFNRESFDLPKKEFHVPRKIGAPLKVVLETSTPYLLSLLEKQNLFLKGRLRFETMLPGALALARLSKECGHVSDNEEVTIIVQVEDDFSHLILLKGIDLLSVTPFFADMVGEGLNNILYSKIIYELDHWQIDQITKVLLASKAANEETIHFFQERMPDTDVRYILSPELRLSFISDYSSQELSVHALPVALALFAMTNQSKECSAANMLPQRILDSQKFFKLTIPGVILFMLLGASALTSTFIILNKRFDNYSLKRENSRFTMEIKANEPIVEEVQMLTEKIAQMTQVTMLADSLIEAYDRVLTFLQQINHNVEGMEDVWVNEIQNTKNGFQIIGQSRDRSLIPALSNSLGKSILRHVYREYEQEPVYTFEIDLTWPSEPMSPPQPAGREMGQFALLSSPAEASPVLTPMQEASPDAKILLTADSSLLRTNERSIVGAKIVAPGETDSIDSNLPEGTADFVGEQTTDSSKRVMQNPLAAAIPTVDTIVSNEPLGPPPPQDSFALVGDMIDAVDAEAPDGDADSSIVSPPYTHADEMAESSRATLALSDDFLDSASFDHEANDSAAREGSLPLEYEPGPDSVEMKNETRPYVQDEIISAHVTDRQEKIFILVSDYFFSKDAVKEVEDLKEVNIEAVILDLRVLGKVKPFWVCIGEFDSIEDANAMIAIVQQRTQTNCQVKRIAARNFVIYRKTSAAI